MKIAVHSFIRNVSKIRTIKLLTLSITAKIVNVELIACIIHLCRSQTQSDHSDKHDNAELSDCFEDISAISNLLKKCSRFKTVKGGGGGGFSPDFCWNTILRYELAMMARTCTNKLRVVFSPYVQHCPCEASEQKWGQKTNI